MAPVSKLIAYVVIATHPPYPAVVTILALAGLANGIIDAAWNAWIGSLAHANQLLGLMHGLYGLGATISPLIATTMITKGQLGWWTFFYLMTGLAAVEIATGAMAFWSETGTKYTAANRADGKDRGMVGESLKQKVTWICAIFLLCYVGLEGKAYIAPLILCHGMKRHFPSQTAHCIDSFTWWLDRELHDPCKKRRAFPIRYDRYRLLARNHCWPYHPWLHHT